MKSFALSHLPAFIRYKVSIAVTFTAITGYIVFKGGFDFQIMQLALSVFLLAGGSSALNQYQERDYDAKMERTMHRPIPAGKIPPNQALLLSLAFILIGLSLLYSFFGIITAALGAFNILWYNLLYTKLKRITPFAVVPGSLTGAVPLLMGWTAAGGYIFESTILFIGFFIYIWQIPHFWLLMLKYRNDYERAGFPTIHQVMSPRNLKRIIFSWIIATSMASIMVPLFNPNVSIAFFSAIFVLNILFVALFIQLSFHDLSEINIRKSFITINIYMFLFMIILSIYHLLIS